MCKSLELQQSSLNVDEQDLVAAPVTSYGNITENDRHMDKAYKDSHRINKNMQYILKQIAPAR